MNTSDEFYRERDRRIREDLRASSVLFIRTLLTHPKLKEARKRVEFHADQEFDRAYTQEIHAVTLHCEELDKRIARLAEELREKEGQERQTKSHLKVAEIRGGARPQDIPYWDWTLKDRIVFLLTVLFMILVLGAGSANVFSAIMMGGHPVFLERPILAVALSFLLPAGSAAIHVLGDLLERDRSRHRYTLTLLGMTVITLFAWAVFFAQNFQINTSGIDWGALGQEDDPTASVFTFVQLLAEMLCGSCLFLGATHIHNRYSGDGIVRNPERDYLAQERKTFQTEYDAVHDRRRELRGRLMQLRAMRQSHVAEQTALFLALRRRFDEANPIQSTSIWRDVMKLVSSWFLLLLFIIVLVSPAQGRDMAIGLSPYVGADAAQRQVKSVLQFLTENLQPGDRALVFDAYNTRVLGTFTIPDNPAYRHPKARIQANRQMVAALLAFAKDARAPQAENEPRVIGAIRFPQALAFIGENYPALQDADLIVLGSPIYDDPSDRQFTMHRQYIPQDDHLSHTRSATPFGIKGQSSLLAGRRVHLGYPDESWRLDDHHAYLIHRFWTLFIEGQGGKLSTFTGDIATLFERVKTNAPVPSHDYKRATSGKLEMIPLRPLTVVRKPLIRERPLSDVRIALETLRRAANVEVGITWECASCDLDLYAKSSPMATALSYHDMKTPEGQYFQDWTSSPRAANRYETLAYSMPIDLTAMFVAVNFYNGTSPGGVHGELRISIDGQTYAKAFHLSASGGNQGAGRMQTLNVRRAANEHWLVINPMDVLGIQPERSGSAGTSGR